MACGARSPPAEPTTLFDQESPMHARSVFATFALATLGLASTASAGPTPAEGPASSPTTIRVTVDSQGFTPSSIEMKKGQSVTLEFVRTTDGTCAKEVVLPALNIKKPLPLNTPVDVPVPSNEAKTYAFACGMGMLKGSVVVR
jgi:plastocyanin domain-containing protein